LSAPAPAPAPSPTPTPAPAPTPSPTPAPSPSPAPAPAPAPGDPPAPTPTSANWDSDHWRATWAGEDPKKKAFAERRTDLKTALDSAYAADQKIAELSAAAKTALPKDATPEQITQYRKDNGIPATPAEYFTALPKDMAASLDDGAKEMLTPYMGLVQELNLPPEAASKMVKVWQAEQDRQVQSRIEADEGLRVKTEDALRGDWGNNYRAGW